MADPKYVRLADHLTRGLRADINSGWSIAGFDVRPMPDKEEEPNSYAYVKGELNAGRLEGASKAEYEEAHPDLLTSDEEDSRPYQEREVQRAAQSVHRKIRARRSGEEATSAYEVDEARRKAVLKSQKAGDKAGSRRGSQSAAEAEDEADAATREAEEARLAEQDGGDEDLNRQG